jgi:hypothetical protein
MRLKLSLTEGDLGLAYTAPGLPTFSDEEYVTPFNSSIAHDLIEHPITHEEGHAGLQELEALGAIFFFRIGYVGTLPGDRKPVDIRDIASDVCNMLPLFFEYGDLVSPTPAKTRINPEIEGILGDLVDYCQDDPNYLAQDYDWDSINWAGFKRLIGQRMSIGLAKFRRRFAKVPMWRLAEVFREIHEVTYNLPNTEPELYLDYCFTKGTAQILYPWELGGNW